MCAGGPRAGYLMMTLGSCVALQLSVAVVPLMTRWSSGGTEMTVRPVQYRRKSREKRKEKNERELLFPLRCSLTCAEAD